MRSNHIAPAMPVPTAASTKMMRLGPEHPHADGGAAASALSRDRLDGGADSAAQQTQTMAIIAAMAAAPSNSDGSASSRPHMR